MMACRRQLHAGTATTESSKMATIIEFPADAASRRPDSAVDGARDAVGTIVILPVVRIEREIDLKRGGTGPEEGTAPGRRRRRR